MNICIVRSPFESPEIVHVVENFVNGLSNHFSSIILLTSTTLPLNLKKNVILKKISKPVLKTIVGKTLSYFLGIILLTVRLIYIQMIYEIDYIIVFGEHFYAGLPVLINNIVFNTPYIVRVSGEGINSSEFKMMGFPIFSIKFLFIMIKKFEKKIFNKAFHIVVLSKFLEKYVFSLRVNHRRITVSSQGVQKSLFRPLSMNNLLTKDLNISNKDKVIIYVGRLRYHKGLSYLIDAMPYVLQKLNNIKLIIVGGGIAKQKLVKLVHKYQLQNKIIFIGAIPHYEVPKYLALSDVFVLPSLSEGLPNTLLEALSCGVPVVTSSIQAFKEIIVEGDTGLLVDIRNPKLLSNAIITILKNEKLAKRFSINGINLIKEKYNKEDWDAQTYVNIIPERQKE